MAKCETCRDSGFRGMVITKVTYPAFRGDGYSTSWSPCPACNGTGEQSCCEGAVGGPYEVSNKPNE